MSYFEGYDMATGAIGRPTKLNAELVKKAKEYMLGGFSEMNSIVPSIAGLGCYLGINKSSIYEYKAQDSELGREFSDTLESIMLKQEVMLVDGGLGMTFNATITKLMLTNHGYSDKIQTETNVTINNSLDDFYADIEKEG